MNPLAILGVQELLEQPHAHRRLRIEAEHAATAFVPDQGAALRLVVPHAQPRGIDRQARAHFHLAQRLFGLQAPAALVDLAQRSFHGLGQKAEVLL